MIVNAKAWDRIDGKMYDAIIGEGGLDSLCLILDSNGKKMCGPISIYDAELAGFSIYPG